MADQSIAEQWKSFDPERRKRLLDQMTPEQMHSLRQAIEASPAPAPAQLPFQGALPSPPDQQRIIQQMTGITPYKSAPAQVLSALGRTALSMGPFALGPTVGTAAALAPAVLAPPRTPEEVAATGGPSGSKFVDALSAPMGRISLAGYRIFGQPAQRAYQQSQPDIDEANQLQENADVIEANAGTEGGLQGLRNRWPQMNFADADQARQRASELRRRALGLRAQAGTIQAVGSIPLVGPAWMDFRNRAAAGDVPGAATEFTASGLLMANPRVGPDTTLTEAAINRPIGEILSRGKDLWQRQMQASVGAGPQLVRRKIDVATERYEGEVHGRPSAPERPATAGHIQDSIDAANQFARDMEEYNRKLVMTRADNLGKIHEYRAKTAEVQQHNANENAQYDVATRHAQQEWEGLQKAHAEGQTATSERDRLEKSSWQGIKDTRARVKGDLDQRWNRMREQMADAAIPVQEIMTPFLEATEKIRGSEEKIKQFQSLQRLLEDPVPDSLSWNDLQGYYEELGAKVYDGPQRGMGDVYQAIKSMHRAIGDTMAGMAEERGLGEQFAANKADYATYMDTFYKTGSPVARSLKAQSSVDAAKPFLEAGGPKRGLEEYASFRNLASYDPNLAAQIRRLGTVSGVVKTAPGEVPGVLKIPQRNLKDPASVRAPQLTDPASIERPEPGGEPRPELHVTDPRKVRIQQLVDSGRSAGRLGQGEAFYLARGVLAAGTAAMAGIATLALTGGHAPAGGALLMAGGLGAAAGGLAVASMRRWAFDRMDSANWVEWFSKPNPKDIEYLEGMARNYPETATRVAQIVTDIKTQKAPQVKLDARLAQWLALAAAARAGQGQAQSDAEQKARAAALRLRQQVSAP